MSLCFIVSCFLATDLLAILFLLIFMLLMIIASNIPIIEFLKSLWTAKIFIILVVVMNIVFFQSIDNLIIISVQLVLIILMTSLVIFTTRISELTYALELLFSPLKIINFPVKKVAFAITLAIRFVPILLTESKKIVKSQKNRIFKDKLSIKDKIINIKNMLFPIFNKSINHADKIAEVMTVRNYTFTTATVSLRNRQVKELDYALMAMQMLLLVAIIVKR